MMIRSLPPASAHFAERPVPAPAPMIGLPAAIWARSRASASALRHDAASISSCSRFAIASANAGSFTSASISCSSTFDVSTSSPDRLEERLVGLRVVEHLALGRDRRDAAQRHEQHGRPGRRVQLLGDDPPDLAALLRRRPHQRDRRVVDVEVPVAIPLRHRLQRAEVDHVERAERDDLRDPQLARPTRAGPAPATSTPPATRSQNSVVVTSSEPAMKPASISASIEPPPAPVWWKTSTS